MVDKRKLLRLGIDTLKEYIEEFERLEQQPNSSGHKLTIGFNEIIFEIIR